MPISIARLRSRLPSLFVSAGLSALSAVAGLTVVPASALGAGSGEALDFTIHQPYVHARAIGMGNAFTAVADDYAAMFYNPAGLAWLEEWQMNFELKAMIDKDVLGLKEDIEKASSTGSNSANSVTEINNLLEKNYGKHFSSRVPTAGWFWVWPRWGMAIVPVDLNLEMEIHQTVGPAAQVVATQDSTISFAHAYSPKWFKKSKIAWGLAVKAIYRGYYNRSLNGIELALDPDVIRLDDAAEGFTVDGDFGLLFQPNWSGWFFRVLRPTFGLAVRNMVDAGFSSDFNLYTKGASAKPPRLQRRFDVGTMWELPDWWVFKSRFAFDVRDMGHEQWTFKKGVHAGVEFKWKLFGWWQGGWRAGINQGYPTLGFTGKLGVFMLDLATYGEEVGSSDTSRESRRYMAKASVDF